MINLNDPVTREGALALGGTRSGGKQSGEEYMWWVTFGPRPDADWPEGDWNELVSVWGDNAVLLFSVSVPIRTMGQLALLLSLLGLCDNSLDAQLAEAITTAAPHDPEVAHCHADNLLVEIVGSAKFTKTVEAFTKLSKWYS